MVLKDKVELIECEGVAEQLEGQRPEYLKFYVTWKRVFLKSGHEGITEYFSRDYPVDFTEPGKNPDNRVCTLGLFEGPNHREEFRVHYRIKPGNRVYVMEIGLQLGIDKIKQ